jgi:hypothetical protein
MAGIDACLFEIRDEQPAVLVVSYRAAETSGYAEPGKPVDGVGGGAAGKRAAVFYSAFPVG